MAFSRLQKLKKTSSEEGKKIDVESLIIGGDLFSYLLYKRLDSKPMFVRPYQEKLVLMGPSLLRGEDNIEVFKSLFPDQSCETLAPQPVFFREQRFREFGGRSKSEKILSGESFYTQKEVLFDENGIFDFDECESSPLIPSNLKKNEDGRWEVHCTNGDIIFCKNLFWGKDPKGLSSVMEDIPEKERIFSYSSALDARTLLHVNLQYSEVASERPGTIFIPVSYTHDWGHFIGTFKDDGRRFECIYHLDKTETSEDEVTKNIKILKRSIEKIFPGVAALECTDEIIVKEYSACEEFDDSLYHPVDNLYLVGPNAPLMGDFSKVTHLTRALLTIDQAIDRLSKN